jgi:hypothetical protein
VVRVTFRGEAVLLRTGGRWQTPQASLPTTTAPTAPAAPDLPTAPGAGASTPGEAGSVDSPTTPRSKRVTARERSPARQARPSKDQPAAPTKTLPAASDRDRYEAASLLEASDPDGAVARYLDLAGEGGVWGANALFAAGRLQLERGRRDAARALLQRYLVRFPTGPNAEEARSLLERRP